MIQGYEECHYDAMYKYYGVFLFISWLKNATSETYTYITKFAFWRNSRLQPQTLQESQATSSFNYLFSPPPSRFRSLKSYMAPFIWQQTNDAKFVCVAVWCLLFPCHVDLRCTRAHHTSMVSVCVPFTNFCNVFMTLFMTKHIYRSCTALHWQLYLETRAINSSFSTFEKPMFLLFARKMEELMVTTCRKFDITDYNHRKIPRGENRVNTCTVLLSL